MNDSKYEIYMEPVHVEFQEFTYFPNYCGPIEYRATLENGT